MNSERTVSLSCVAAIGLWVITFGLVLSGSLVGVCSQRTHLSLALLGHGLALSAAAATITMRNAICRQNRLLQHAFDLGKARGSALRQVR